MLMVSEALHLNVFDQPVRLLQNCKAMEITLNSNFQTKEEVYQR